MKALYLFKRTISEIKTHGIKNTLTEYVVFDRTMVAIEQHISHKEDIKRPFDIDIQIIDKTNRALIRNKYRKDTFEYYTRKGATCLAAFKGNNCLGYQWWTQDNRFKDLKKLCITLKDNEVYLFNLFVFPEYRGTEIPKLIAQESFNYLVSKGITKFYGFYFSDNIKALWWHRAFLRCREIKKVRIRRFMFFEQVSGRLMLTIV